MRRMDIDEATLDQTAKLFKSLPITDQVAALYEMLRYVRGEIALVKKELIAITGELKKARTPEDQLTTSQKIRTILSTRFDTWIWFRDKVLPYIILAIMFAVFQLTWGAK